MRMHDCWMIYVMMTPYYQQQQWSMEGRIIVAESQMINYTDQTWNLDGSKQHPLQSILHRIHIVVGYDCFLLPLVAEMMIIAVAVCVMILS